MWGAKRGIVAPPRAPGTSPGGIHALAPTASRLAAAGASSVSSSAVDRVLDWRVSPRASAVRPKLHSSSDLPSLAHRPRPAGPACTPSAAAGGDPLAWRGTLSSARTPAGGALPRGRPLHPAEPFYHALGGRGGAATQDARRYGGDEARSGWIPAGSDVRASPRLPGHVEDEVHDAGSRGVEESKGHGGDSSMEEGSPTAALRRSSAGARRRVMGLDGSSVEERRAIAVASKVATPRRERRARRRKEKARRQRSAAAASVEDEQEKVLHNAIAIMVAARSERIADGGDEESKEASKPPALVEDGAGGHAHGGAFGGSSRLDEGSDSEEARRRRRHRAAKKKLARHLSVGSRRSAELKQEMDISKRLLRFKIVRVEDQFVEWHARGGRRLTRFALIALIALGVLLAVEDMRLLRTAVIKASTSAHEASSTDEDATAPPLLSSSPSETLNAGYHLSTVLTVRLVWMSSQLVLLVLILGNFSRLYRRRLTFAVLLTAAALMTPATSFMIDHVRMMTSANAVATLYGRLLFIPVLPMLLVGPVMAVLFRYVLPAAVVTTLCLFGGVLRLWILGVPLQADALVSQGSAVAVMLIFWVGAAYRLELAARYAFRRQCCLTSEKQTAVAERNRMRWFRNGAFHQLRGGRLAAGEKDKATVVPLQAVDRDEPPAHVPMPEALLSSKRALAAKAGSSSSAAATAAAAAAAAAAASSTAAGAPRLGSKADSMASLGSMGSPPHSRVASAYSDGSVRDRILAASSDADAAMQDAAGSPAAAAAGTATGSRSRGSDGSYRGRRGAAAARGERPADAGAARGGGGGGGAAAGGAAAGGSVSSRLDSADSMRTGSDASSIVSYSREDELLAVMGGAFSPRCYIRSEDLTPLRELGRGSSGSVALMDLDGTRVAVKRIEKVVTPAALVQFGEEASILAELRHPNIVMFMGVALQPTLQLVMEYCSRGSLYQVLHVHKVMLDWTMTLKLLVDTASGVQFLHARSHLLHRDLKSTNILVDRDWRCKLADFGLSSLLSSSRTGSGSGGAYSRSIGSGSSRSSGSGSSRGSSRPAAGRPSAVPSSSPTIARAAEASSLSSSIPASAATTASAASSAAAKSSAAGSDALSYSSSRRSASSSGGISIAAMARATTSATTSALPAALSVPSDGGASAMSSPIGDSSLLPTHSAATLAAAVVAGDDDLPLEEQPDRPPSAVSSEGSIALAAAGTDATRRLEQLSSLRWCAPEVFAGEEYGRAADVYAFGIVMFECLYKVVPFQGEEALSVPHLVAKGRRPTAYVEPFLFPPKLRGLQKIMQACWAARPEERPTMAEVLDTLHETGETYGGKDWADAVHFPVVASMQEKRLLPAAASVNPADVLLQECIGRGISGRVYRGSYLGTDVAVKELPINTLPAEAVTEFNHETAFLISLRHPNILLYLGACEMNGRLYMVTELMQLGSVHSLYTTKKLPHPRRRHFQVVRRIAMDVCRGMAFLHEQATPVIHRDLKSPNVLLSSTLRAKIADFGLATVKDEQRILTSCGSPLWTAPEVLRGDRFDERCDIYSFSIVLWELINWSEPYPGQTAKGVMTGVLSEGLRPELPPDCPTALEQMLLRCWSDDPAERPTFLQLLDELEQLPAGFEDNFARRAMYAGERSS